MASSINLTLHRYPFWLLLLWGTSAATLPWLLQLGAAWRDGPEFVVAAWGLGIAHPAGYPLYQAIVWMFEQFPLGDIVLRNHAFSALFTLVAMVLLYELALSFIQLLTSGSEATGAKHVAGWTSLVWLVMPAQMENAVQSEAYSLFAAFMFLIAKLLVDFARTQEPRRYILATFLAGIGCGNHIMTGAMLFALAPALALIKQPRRALATAGGGLVAGLAGLLVYLYLPVRSRREPVFDWGNPETWARFWAQVSDRKDASSHMEVVTASGNGSSAFMHHMLVLHDWLGLPGMMLISAGWLWLLVRKPRLAWMMLGPALFLFAFFLGWVSGTVLTGALGLLLIGGAVCMAMLITLPYGKKVRLAGMFAAVTIALSTFLASYKAGVVFLAERTHYLPGELNRAPLLALPYRASVLAGPAWFHLAGLQHLEGMRPDVTVISLGDIISPQYFRPLRPHHIPLLQYPAIRQPETGELPDRQKAEFLKQLMSYNAGRSHFFLDMDESYIHVFMKYIEPWHGLWWASLAARPVANDCGRIGSNLQQSLGAMLHEPQAITDPEFGRYLQYGFFSWSKVALNRQPYCLRVSKTMLRWWLTWESGHVAIRPGTIENDLGVTLVRMGNLRGARVLFQLAAEQGLDDGMNNLAVLYLNLGDKQRAAKWLRRAFVQRGNHAAWRAYRNLMRGTASL